MQIARSSTLPSSWVANTLYLVALDSAGTTELYVTDADATPTQVFVLEDIAQRDSLSPTAVVYAYVKNASDDPHVERGPASYKYDDEGTTWAITTEFDEWVDFLDWSLSLKTYQAPSSGGGGGDVVVVNDLTTGGTTSALSAEMGKSLKGLVDGKVQNNLNASTTVAPSATAVNTGLAGKVPTTRQVNGHALSADVTLTAADVGAVATGAVGANNGVAPLDSSGKVPSANLPSYVDDVLEYADLAAFPATGEAGKMYIAIDTGTTYRWSGSTYIAIVGSPGSTDAVPEGSTNLYFTVARVRSAVLTGLSLATSAAISATDTVLGAFGKLQAQITTLFNRTINGHALTGDVTLTAADVGAVTPNGVETLNSKTLNSAVLDGVTTVKGAFLQTSHDMGGGTAIDPTKNEKKSINADTTFTFAADPTTPTSVFVVDITNTDSAPHRLTFPSFYSQVMQGNRTVVPIAANGFVRLVFLWDGSYKCFGDTPFASKFNATAAPGVNDDETKGFGPGSLWGNATGNALYWCESAAAGAAVWNSIGGGGVDLDTANTWTAGQAVVKTAIGDGETVNIDPTESNTFRVVLSASNNASRTLANPSPNPIDSQTIRLFVKQPASGGPCNFTAFGSKWKFPGDVEPTLSTDPGAVDCIVGVYDGTDDVIRAQVAKGWSA